MAVSSRARARIIFFFHLSRYQLLVFALDAHTCTCRVHTFRGTQSFGIIKMNAKWGFSLINSAMRREWMRWHCSMFNCDYMRCDDGNDNDKLFAICCCCAHASVYDRPRETIVVLLGAGIPRRGCFKPCGCFRPQSATKYISSAIGIQLHIFPTGEISVSNCTKTRMMQRKAEKKIEK